ncbi:hypothetical protein TrCOL_g2163 [Triparma columacea]|uniref:Uncharacterized protein n=1 Tax=Triparma columacea TaxID=722753 RepID=A0A9W7LDZ4_9STRA|nr:hypothetical protein TrCOL_g2163 [Triparma columacea]
MSLQSAGASTIPNTRHEKKASLRLDGRGTNDVSDIDGARPTEKMNRFTKKPNYTYDITDIQGSRPLPLHRETNSVVYNLKLDDIEGARPRGATHQNVRLKNPVDPLVPHYKLPSYELPPDGTPKFLRDNLDVTDIQGTRSKPLYKFPTRESFEVRDIEGAQAGWKPRHKRVQSEGVPRDIMEVADINQQGVKKSQRCTDPLRPVHFINGMEVKDDMKYTMPKRLPPKRDGPFFPLTTKDIEGAYPGWTPPHAMQPPIEQRRHFRNTNFVGDIAGAQSDTVMHCIKTNRVTNPLNPSYTDLDGMVMQSDQPKTKATLEAEASLRYAMENSMRQEAEARARMEQDQSTMPFNNTTEFADISVARQGEFVAPVQAPQPETNNYYDEKDQRIAQLEAEVSSLRGTFAGGGTGAGGWVGGGGGEGGGGGGSMKMTNGFRAPSPSSQTMYRQPSPALSARSNKSRQPSPALSARSNRSARSVRSSRSNQEADRMVLRSSDGQPRVKLTPREVRQQKQYADDVAAVRDL